MNWGCCSSAGDVQALDAVGFHSHAGVFHIGVAIAELERLLSGSHLRFFVRHGRAAIGQGVHDQHGRQQLQQAGDRSRHAWVSLLFCLPLIVG